MAFNFRFASLLRVRENLEEELQLKLAREQAVLKGHQDQLAELRDQRRQMLADMEERKKKSISGSLFMHYMNGIRSKELEIVMQENTVASQEKVISELRGQLVEAMKKRKTMEVIKERDWRNYLHEFKRQEQNSNDEQAVLRYGRG
ncbi:MAG: flagellar export protein FliJ [Desulfurivibrionaceae bacterium]